MFVDFYTTNKGQSIRTVRIFTILGFLFFYGLRGYVFSDWYNYEYFFQNLTTFWSGNFINEFNDNNREVGFFLYSVIIKSICPNYFFWTFISSFIDVLLLDVIFRRYAKYYVLAFVVFYVFAADVMMFNYMRNIKSILLFLISLKYLHERKFLPYILLNLAGISFHISALVYIPLYFVLHRRFSKLLMLITFVAGKIGRAHV
jgi:hypothetical protein